VSIFAGLDKLATILDVSAVDLAVKKVLVVLRVT